MEPTQPENRENDFQKNKPGSDKKKDGKFMAGLKKAGFNVWLAVMIIGGSLAILIALFLL